MNRNTLYLKMWKNDGRKIIDISYSESSESISTIASSVDKEFLMGIYDIDIETFKSLNVIVKVDKLMEYNDAIDLFGLASYIIRQIKE